MTPRSRRMTLFAGSAAISLLLWKTVATPLPLLVWNASASVSVGLYVVAKQRPDLGEIAVLKPPRWVALIAEERRYLPRSIWLLKPVAAVDKDVVCRFGAYVFINAKVVARAQRRDSQHRPMPFWRGCLKLDSGQLLLLSKRRASFDSRYFGPVDASLVIGTAKPIILFRE